MRPQRHEPDTVGGIGSGVAQAKTVPITAAVMLP